MDIGGMHSDARDAEQAPPPVSLTMPATVAECHAVIQALALEVGQLREQTAWLQDRLVSIHPLPAPRS
jgi:hypothetical protein